MPNNLRDRVDYNLQKITIHNCCYNLTISVRVSTQKCFFFYMDVVFDNRMKYMNHFGFLISKLRKCVNAFRQLRNI